MSAQPSSYPAAFDQNPAFLIIEMIIMQFIYIVNIFGVYLTIT